MKCLLKVTVVHKPLSGELIGFRIVAAEVNMAARKMYKNKKLDEWRATKVPAPSFRRPYLISTSSDYPEPPSDEEIEKFKQKLSWFGYNEFEVLK